MTSKKASDYLHGEEGYNCAQAILKTFEKEYAITQEKIDSYAAYGAGQAEDGLCGALYAAKELLNNPEKTELLKEKFTKEAGSPECRPILKQKKLSCWACVDLAAEIVKDNSK